MDRERAKNKNQNIGNKNIYGDIQLLKDKVRCWRRFVNLVKEKSKE